MFTAATRRQHLHRPRSPASPPNGGVTAPPDTTRSVDETEINSAIDELIPARRRGATDLSINSSYWLGTILASALSLVLLDPSRVPESIGWRLCFGIGAVLALCILVVRRFIPESPRWLLTHGRVDEAEAIVRQIEEEVQRQTGAPLPPPEGKKISIDTSHRTGFAEVVRTMVKTYPHIFPFAVGNLVGPWLLDRLFDVVGRRKMIAGTYIISVLLLLGTGFLFLNGALNATTITIAWSVVFFFASAGASSAYLTASEIFPMETRAVAIAVVYAVGTLTGGAAAPLLFGALIATKQPMMLFIGYLLGSSLMIVGGIVEAIWGVDAEQKSLEQVAAPLSAMDSPARKERSTLAAAT